MADILTLSVNSTYDMMSSDRIDSVIIGKNSTKMTESELADSISSTSTESLIIDIFTDLINGDNSSIVNDLISFNSTTNSIVNDSFPTNSTNSTTFEPEVGEQLEEFNTFILPLWQQIGWSLIFGAMVMVAVFGNLIVVWVVVSTKKMRTVTNYFIVNLSIADTMVSTLNVIFNFVYMLDGDWPFGSSYCKVSNFIAILSVAASVLTLVAIALDR